MSLNLLEFEFNMLLTEYPRLVVSIPVTHPSTERSVIGPILYLTSLGLQSFENDIEKSKLTYFEIYVPLFDSGTSCDKCDTKMNQTCGK